MKRTACIISIFTLGLLIGVPRALAQTANQQLLHVSPVITDVTLTPGQTTTYPLTVTNDGDKPVGFHLSVTGIDITSNDASDQSLSSPFLSWIQVVPSDLIVAPHDKSTFTVNILTPPNAKKSGYYAALFLTPFISSPLPTSGPIIEERIGTLLLATVGKLDYADLIKKTQLTDVQVVSDSLVSPQALTFSVHNDYFTHFTAKPFLTLSPFFKHSTTLLLEEKHVLPGRSRTWTIPFTMSWYTPITQVRLAVSIGDGKQLLTHLTVINYPLLIELAVALMLLFIVLTRAKQLKKAGRILLTGHQ